MKVLLDTNVLLRMAVASHPTYAEAVAAVYRLRQRGDRPAIVPQVLYEYWVVATRPFAEWTWSQHSGGTFGDRRVSEVD